MILIKQVCCLCFNMQVLRGITIYENFCIVRLMFLLRGLLHYYDIMFLLYDCEFIEIRSLVLKFQMLIEYCCFSLDEGRQKNGLQEGLIFSM